MLAFKIIGKKIEFGGLVLNCLEFKFYIRGQHKRNILAISLNFSSYDLIGLIFCLKVQCLIIVFVNMQYIYIFRLFL